ncbi:MAG: hypothetical protein NUV80_06500 [Candidatus Berkelbacteria bacterium]|nr:hypothetical protein [Candidatus Berkelbacteria bacterium]
MKFDIWSQLDTVKDNHGWNSAFAFVCPVKDNPGRNPVFAFAFVCTVDAPTADSALEKAKQLGIKFPAVSMMTDLLEINHANDL